MPGHGGGAEHHPISDVADQDSLVVRDASTVVTVHEALKTLGQANPRLEKVIEYRFFGGMTETEAAAALILTERTIRREWYSFSGLGQNNYAYFLVLRYFCAYLSGMNFLKKVDLAAELIEG